MINSISLNLRTFFRFGELMLKRFNFFCNDAHHRNENFQRQPMRNDNLRFILLTAGIGPDNGRYLSGSKPYPLSFELILGRSLTKQRYAGTQTVDNTGKGIAGFRLVRAKAVGKQFLDIGDF